jgi:AcrR family transcriptional regulator
MAAYRHVSGKDDVLELMVDLVYGEVDIPGDATWRETMRALATDIRALVLKHPWLTRLSAAQAAYELTPNRMALAERALAAVRRPDLDADTTMSVFRTVAAYVHGATSAEIGLRQLMQERNWTSGAETRTGLSAQMTWLLGTGRYPADLPARRPDHARRSAPGRGFHGVTFGVRGPSRRLPTCPRSLASWALRGSSERVGRRPIRWTTTGCAAGVDRCDSPVPAMHMRI